MGTTLRVVYPVVEGYKDSAAFGFRLNMGDRLGLNSLDLTLAYSPDTKLDSSERMHAKLGFARPPWTVQLGQNATDFYDQLENGIVPALLAGGAHLEVAPVEAPFLDMGTPEALEQMDAFIQAAFGL